MKTDLAHRRLRSHTVRVIRDTLASQGFEEVITPILVPEVNTEPHIEYFRVGKNYLIASPELGLKDHLFLMWDQDPQVKPKIFQISPVFRAGRDESGPLHHNEFLMTEYYHSCPSLKDGINFFKSICDSVFREFQCQKTPTLESYTVADLFFQRTGIVLDFNDKSCLLEVLKKFNPHSSSLKSSQTQNWNDLFHEAYVCALEPWLQLQEFCVLTHFPRSVSSMARPCHENPYTVERFEVLFRGVELCNGYMECFQPEIIRQQMQVDQQSLKQDRAIPQEWLGRLTENWNAHQTTLPPICGVAFGVERLCLMLTQHKKEGRGEGIQPFL